LDHEKGKLEFVKVDVDNKVVWFVEFL
jgi:hypothetical protein